MKIRNKIMAGALSVTLACGIPFFAGCNEDKIKDLESQVSTLQSEKTKLEGDVTALTNEKRDLQNLNTQIIDEATYQMLCAVMSQLSICDMDTKIEYDNDSNKNDSKYNSYKTFVASANKFAIIWNKITNSNKAIKINTSYKLVNSEDDNDFEVVLFNYQNDHYYASIYSDKLVSTDDSGNKNYQRTCLKLDMVYLNGVFSSISMSDIMWARKDDSNGNPVQNSQMSDESTKISFDSSKEDLSERWITTSAGAEENRLESGVSEVVNGTFDEDHTISTTA